MKNGTGRKIRICQQCGKETESTRGNGAKFCLKCAKQRLDNYYKKRKKVRAVNIQSIYWKDLRERLFKNRNKKIMFEARA